MRISVLRRPYYAHLFDMTVVIREAPLGSADSDADRWGQLPRDRTWEDADRAGIEIGMVALQRGEVILPLFAGEPSGGRFYAIGLVMSPEEIAAVADRLGDETVESRTQGWLAFVDRFGVRWQLSDTAPCLGAATTRGDWLEV
jgi:hypothetical protein